MHLYQWLISLTWGSSDKAKNLIRLPLEERVGLLDSPQIPFDGLNERGLAIGMAAVPSAEIESDPEKRIIGSLGVIREVLDHAIDIDEAVSIFGRYNIEWGGGPPLHYLVADVSGRSVLIEFYRNEMLVLETHTSWHAATNFIHSAVQESVNGKCGRYDRIDQQLSRTEGLDGVSEAFNLLKIVSQITTQWSIVYGMEQGDIHIVMGRMYNSVHKFNIAITEK